MYFFEIPEIYFKKIQELARMKPISNNNSKVTRPINIHRPAPKCCFDPLP